MPGRMIPLVSVSVTLTADLFSTITQTDMYAPAASLALLTFKTSHVMQISISACRATGALKAALGR